MLNSYAESGTLRFHLPGHAGGRWPSSAALAGIEGSVLAADTSQVLDLDDIHYPFGALGQAQDLTCRLYGTDRCWFLVNGSTVGVQAMALAALRDGARVIVPRNAHRSIHGAVLLSGAEPIYAAVPYDDVMEVAHGLTVAELQRLLKQHPNVEACLFESLSAYGAAADVAGLVAAIHGVGGLALADEAWGAHLLASPRLPQSACGARADLIVQSAHKTLSALGQAAWLHQCGSSVDPARIAEVLRILQTSSPSSLIMASLDGARRELAVRGEHDWERTVDLANWARERIAAETVFCCPVPNGAFACDPTRVVISGRRVGCGGQLLECRLRYRHNIQVDMSDPCQALLSFTPAHGEEDVERLIAALCEVGSVGQGQDSDLVLPPFPAWETAEMTPRQAWQQPRALVPWERAAGRISAGRIVTYPPGISLVCPGERFSAEQAEYLRQVLDLGCPVEGINDEGMVACVR
ncbi:hypothetical protein IJT17_04510, partial [bacterium]|nr:hypothetical protein [bacterium]